MRESFKRITKISSLFVGLSLIVAGLFANNNYVVSELNTIKNKTMPETKTITKVQLAELLVTDIDEESRQLEDWMFKVELKSNNFDENRSLENWMFNSEIWKVKTFEWEINPIEEEREIEDWMLEVKLLDVGCKSLSPASRKAGKNFTHNAWVKKHSFLIL